MSKNQNQNQGSVRAKTRQRKRGKSKPKPTPKTPAATKTPATREDYLAGALHAAKVNVLNLRRAILEKDALIGGLQKIILDLQAAGVEASNAKLREEHSLEVGGQIDVDPETGLYFRTSPK